MDFFTDDEYEPGYSIEQKVIYGSLGIGGGITITGMMIYFLGSVRVGGALLILGMIAGLLPYGVLSFLKNRAVREMENQFPSFLNDLAESKRGGMTILKAFESAKDTDYGRLNSEVEKVHTDLTWGIPFPEVMERFSKRMKASPVIQESLSIIIQSFQSGGNITDTIESVAENASDLKEVLQSKRSQLKQQLFIMYIIYFLFIGITIGIYVMLSQLLGLGSQEAGALQGIGEVLGGDGGSAGPTNFCGKDILAARPFCSTAKIFGFIPTNITDLGSSYATKYAYGKMAYYKSLLFTMLMVQGMCTAAVSGQISEGSPSAGVKHAIIMMPIAFIVFMLVLRPMGV
ncbi:type II secretion system F family protein [Candidatus Nanohalobium constans]|uniref:Archaeal flagellar protein FlaJ n=1 Tax=Candidatus Nanohalobium constans TaxID=2565781 RepID=A0A5Q0UF75_9ARCH|nr:type II secretion system F family protein [Candidatus Nanohalobium constans]QGA80253.1 archaeal flagellar protein FlaJ [Candidatus Nanohalobium constans]